MIWLAGCIASESQHYLPMSLHYCYWTPKWKKDFSPSTFNLSLIFFVRQPGLNRQLKITPFWLFIIYMKSKLSCASKNIRKIRSDDPLRAWSTDILRGIQLLFNCLVLQHSA
jgi:hypothetical protein